MTGMPTVIGAGLCSLLLASLGFSQERNQLPGDPGESMSGQELRNVGRLLDSREREFLYPTEERSPLEIVGIDQEENNFRSGTPALQNADMTVAMVDTEMARERLLSLYGGEQVTPEPLGLAAPGGYPSGSPRNTSASSDRNAEVDADDDNGDSEHSSPWYYGVPLLGLAAAWVWTKTRS